MQRPEFRAWLESELVTKAGSGRRIELERLRLATRAIEREHAELLQRLTKRMLSGEREHLAHRVGVPPELEPGAEAELRRDEPQLLEPGRLGAGEVVVRNVGVRASSPQREPPLGERGGERRVPSLESGGGLGGELLEAFGIERTRGELEPVARRPRADAHRVGKRFSKLRDVDLQELPRRRRRGLAPDGVDQLVGRERARVGDDERCE